MSSSNIWHHLNKNWICSVWKLIRQKEIYTCNAPCLMREVAPWHYEPLFVSSAPGPCHSAGLETLPTSPEPGEASNWTFSLKLILMSSLFSWDYCCYEDAEMFTFLGKLKTATTTLALLTGSQWSHFTARFVFGKVICLKIYWQRTKSSTWLAHSPARNIDMPVTKFQISLLPWCVS